MMNPNGPRRSTIVCGAMLVVVLGAGGCERHGTESPAPALQGSRTGASTPAIPPGQTGAVEGRVHFEGASPDIAPLQTSEGVARQCGNQVEDRSLVVGKDGAIVGAVASLNLPDAQPPASGGADAGTVEVDQKGCVFVPAIVAARTGATIVMKNSDPLTHNIRANQKVRELYNIAMPITGMTLKRTLPKEPGVVKLHCDIHPWMNARVATFSHPYFAQADEAGHFRIEHVPAGHQQITLWLPRLATKTVEVDVPPNGTAKLDVTWSAADVHPLD